MIDNNCELFVIFYFLPPSIRVLMLGFSWNKCSLWSIFKDTTSKGSISYSDWTRDLYFWFPFQYAYLICLIASSVLFLVLYLPRQIGLAVFVSWIPYISDSIRHPFNLVIPFRLCIPDSMCHVLKLQVSRVNSCDLVIEITRPIIGLFLIFLMIYLTCMQHWIPWTQNTLPLSLLTTRYSPLNISKHKVYL
jgi:hypothetical protein